MMLSRGLRSCPGTETTSSCRTFSCRRSGRSLSPTGLGQWKRLVRDQPMALTFELLCMRFFVCNNSLRYSMALVGDLDGGGVQGSRDVQKSTAASLPRDVQLHPSSFWKTQVRVFVSISTLFGENCTGSPRSRAASAFTVPSVWPAGRMKTGKVAGAGIDGRSTSQPELSVWTRSSPQYVGPQEVL